jgi:Ca-activated chloride channel family protein
MSFSFERPLLALAALAIIPVTALVFRKLKNPFGLLIPLGPPGGIPFKAPVNIEGLIKTLRVLEYTGALLLLLCAGIPVITVSKTVWLNQGADILFILDTSPSMAAIDMNGTSRFTASRELLKEFAGKRPSDGIGLAAVGSDAALLVPLTTDRRILFSRLDQLQIAELGDGTALGSGLALAALHLEKSKAPRRAAVLITDGENNAGAVHPQTAAETLGNMGISLWVIGIGSGGEVPIDYTDPYTKMHRTGIFDSRFDIENLRKISQAGGGDWLYAPSAEALNAAFARIDDHEMVVRRSGLAAHKHSCRLPFLLGAFGLLVTVRFVRRFLLGAFT